MAAQELMEEHPAVKITVVDSLGASMGEGLFVHKAVRMRDEGGSPGDEGKRTVRTLESFM